MNDKELFSTKASLTHVDFNAKREPGKQSAIKEQKLMTLEDFLSALKERDKERVCENQVHITFEDEEIENELLSNGKFVNAVDKMITLASNINGGLESYFRENNAKNIIDYHLRVSIENDIVKFYIHPQNIGGDTLDYEVNGNKLKLITI